MTARPRLSPVPTAHRPNPYDQDAEDSMLGAALMSEKACDVLVRQLEPEDFYVPRNVVLCAVLQDMLRQYMPIDPILVAAELDRRGEMGKSVEGPHVLVALQNACPSTSRADAYAAVIRGHAARRRLIAAAEAALLDAQNLEVDLGAVSDRIRTTFGNIDLPLTVGDADPDVEVFLDGPTEYSWLIDPLMAEGDRLIITGGEGQGKSTLTRQLSVCAAAGINPFTLRAIRPVRVLIVDCENSEIQVRRKMLPLVARAQRQATDRWDPENLRICIKLDGLDLMERKDVRWLTERIEANEPQLLVIGPLYKLHAGDPIDEAPARHVARTLDILRERYNIGIVIEAHSPYAAVDGKRVGRPYGASLWSRWPEFGYCIAKTEPDSDSATFEAWRGARDERGWPKTLRMGNWQNPDEWPWVQSGFAYDPDYGRRQPTNQPTNDDAPPRDEYDDGIGF